MQKRPFWDKKQKKYTTTIVAAETTTKKRQKIEIVVRNSQKSLRVVTIVPLQSLLSNSRERGRVLGRRVQPSGKKYECSLSGFQNPEGLGPKTQTVSCRSIASWSHPEVNTINIPIYFQIMRS